MALVSAISGKTGWDDVVPELLDAQCGYCGKAVAMQRVTAPVEYLHDDHYPGSMSVRLVWAVYVCPRAACLKPTSMFFHLKSTDYSGHAYIDGDPGQLPRGRAEPMEGLPDAIQEDRLEAWSCYYGGDRRAAVIMGRAAIQRAARQLKAEGAGLKAEIADLANRGIITKTLKDAADEVRIAGDDAAHPEELGTIEPAEAKESLAFMDEFLGHAIAFPAKREARKLARQQEAEPAS
jgi:hypothetical protein